MIKKTLILISILVAIIGIGTASLYTKTWNPSWNPFLKSNDILNLSFQKIQQVKTVESSVYLKINSNELLSGDYQKPLSVDYLLKANGLIDRKEQKFPKIYSDFKLSASLSADKESLDKLFPKLNKDIFFKDGKIFLSLEFEEKSIGNDIYYKLKLFPLYDQLNGYFSSLGIKLPKIKGIWIKIDKENLEKLGIKIYSANYQKSQKIIDKIQNNISKNKIFYVEKVLKSEKIDEYPCYHYLISINPENLLDLILDIYKISYKGELSESEYQEYKEQFLKVYNDFIEKSGPINFEIYIDKKSYFIRKFKFERNFDIQKIENTDKSAILYIDFELKNNKFNQPVEISVPKDYRNLSDIIKEFQDYFKIPIK